MYTTSQVLKNVIDSLFATHGIRTSYIRGQGYDESSNMSRNIDGLESLILRENKCDFYIHYFSHQLQLTLVIVAIFFF